MLVSFSTHEIGISRGTLLKSKGIGFSLSTGVSVKLVGQILLTECPKLPIEAILSKAAPPGIIDDVVVYPNEFPRLLNVRFESRQVRFIDVIPECWPSWLLPTPNFGPIVLKFGAALSNFGGFKLSMR